MICLLLDDHEACFLGDLCLIYNILDVFFYILRSNDMKT